MKLATSRAAALAAWALVASAASSRAEPEQMKRAIGPHAQIVLSSPSYDDPASLPPPQPASAPAVSGASSSAAKLRRVPVLLGVMSRCPDALYCERVWDDVLAATTKHLPPSAGGKRTVNAHVDLTLRFIGEPLSNNSSSSGLSSHGTSSGEVDGREQEEVEEEAEGKYGVACKHGDQECLGNIQELCVMQRLKSTRVGEKYDLSPSAAQRTWWEFVQCLNYAGTGEIGQADQKLAKKCLDLVGGPGWEKDGVKQCIEGKEGRELLRKSVVQAKEQGIR